MINNKGEKHGQWEGYYDNGTLFYKGHYVNGKRLDLWEQYFATGNLWFKDYYNNQGNAEGICIL